MDEFEKAIEYVRENMTYFAPVEVEEKRPLPWSVKNEIINLMEEYSEENSLPEGWWYEEMDEFDIFFKL